MGDGNDGINEAYFREHLETARERGEAAPHPVVAELDDPVARSAVAKIVMAYDEGVATDYENFEDTPLYRLITAGHDASMTVAEDVDEGNTGRIAFRKGAPEDDRHEATGYDLLLDAFRPAAQQILIKGPKGSGKTGAAIDLIRRAAQDGIVEKVMLNLPLRGMDDEVLEEIDRLAPEDETHEWLTNDDRGDFPCEVRFAEDISDFLEFAKAPGEKVALLDEFSTVGNAYNNQQAVEAIMGKSINAFRKSAGGSLRTVYIGHENDNDIHPLVKKQSDVVMKKDGKVEEGLIDCATVYRGWEDYEQGEEWFSLRGLRDVPERSPWRYDTEYFSHLEWDLDNPEIQIQRGRLIDGWEQFQEDGEGDDKEQAEDEHEVRCRGTNRHDEQCGNLTSHESGYCKRHRPAWDGGVDPRFADDE